MCDSHEGVAHIDQEGQSCLIKEIENDKYKNIRFSTNTEICCRI
jgi:hypothetical protein